MRLFWIQAPLYWKDKQANLNYFSEQLSVLKEGEIDLIVLPEMFTSGFCMEPEGLAEEHEGLTWLWMAGISAKTNALILGSYITQESGKFYNRLHVAFPNGNHLHYDKRHLFGYAGEDKSYTAGHQLLDFYWKGFKIRPLVCFDLRFPVWSRTTNTDLLIYVANWPDARIKAWNQLLVARAIENQCYVLGVNRTGVDGYGIAYSGYSALYQFDGACLEQSTAIHYLGQYSLDKQKLEAFQRRFPFHQSADNFTINS